MIPVIYNLSRMIRQTVTIRGDPSLHHGQISCYLPGMQDGETVRVAQGDSHLYLNYRLSEKMGQKSADLSLQLMALNHLEDGECVVEQQKSVRIEHLQVKVSRLSWKIVNMNQMKIAQSFLGQISIVWPGAFLPIFYDSHNSVTLSPQVQQVCKLDVNTTVEFIEEEAEDPKEAVSQTIQSQQTQFEAKLSLRGYCDFQEGYLNVVRISKANLEGIGFKEQERVLWIVQNQLQFADCPSIQELVDLQKRRQSSTASSEEQQFDKKLVILEAQHSDEATAADFFCSKLCKKVVGISDSCCLSNNKSFRPQIQILTLEIFLNDPNLTITIEQIIKDEHLYSEQEFAEMSESIVQSFVARMINQLLEKGSFFILQNCYPYCFGKELFTLTLTQKKEKEVKNGIYEIRLLEGNGGKKDGLVEELARGKVVFASRKYPPSMLNCLGQRYEEMSKWVQVVKEHFREQQAQHLDQTKEDSITTLFSSIYQPEIEKVMNFIENTSQRCCLVTSFGSNGKTLLHATLAREGERMWKVNFRELSDPSLSFANIELYLHWVFASSPYQLIYLDDLEALCGKIEDGDQHRKKQKVISKLISRTIAKLAASYKKRMIVTAKSEGAIDQEFKHDIVVPLKNPSREQREAALKELHIVVQPDDSPIHKVKSLSHARRVTQERVDEVTANTESLTLAAFSHHAINLTTPKTAVASSVADFSKLAGLASAKQAIRSMIEKPIKYAFLFKSVPIKLPRGMLLYGGTGNGKTALGSALKDEFKMKYFSVKGSDILSKYIGGSEAAVRDIFEKALSVSPSIIFFDEFESIVPKRSANNTGVNDRIVNQFLCYLDGVSAISGVYIVAASSRPDLIDPAVLRPGRLDSHLFLDYPTAADRKEMINLFGHSVKIDIDESTVVQATQNFSYSDLIGLLKELRIKRSAEVLKKENYEVQEFTHIGEELFWETMKAMKLSVNAGEQEKQRKLYQNFGEGKAPDVKKQRQIQH